MDADNKKMALRMIPYGIYVLTAKTDSGEIAAATVNWVTQTSFDPPLVVVGVKADSGACQILKQSGSFALNFLGQGQQGAAFTFFKPVDTADGTLSGEAFHGGAPPGVVSCSLPLPVGAGRPPPADLTAVPGAQGTAQIH